MGRGMATRTHQRTHRGAPGSQRDESVPAEALSPCWHLSWRPLAPRLASESCRPRLTPSDPQTTLHQDKWRFEAFQPLRL